MTETQIAVQGSDNHLLEMALQQKASIDTIERLVALRERAMAQHASREFHEAFADFQAKCPTVKKLREAKIDSSRTGVKFSYGYADASDIVNEIGADLYTRGFSYSFDTEVAAGQCKVTCRLHHKGGHSESSHVSVPTDSSAAMSPQQKIAAARSFAKRLALMDVLGLFTADPSPEELHTKGMEHITPDQAANMAALLDEFPAERRKQFMQIAGLEHVADCPVNRYAELMGSLQKARKGGSVANPEA